MTQAKWWRGGVIYQIYPRSYMDSNGDGIGDLNGIIERLEHISDLGADAIWISPFVKSPMKDFGYDVSDYYDVDPVFGTLDDFKKLVHRAHELGLKVMMDQVWSHTSDQHDWFKESRLDRTNARHDWYVWADPKPDGTAPNNWLSYFGGPAWSWNARREQYYLHHFLKEQPSLNIWNKDVRKAIKDIAAFWLDIGVDGFRLDVAHAYLYDMKLRDNPVRTKDDLAPTDMTPANPMYYQVRKYSMNVGENLEWVEELSGFVQKWQDRALLGEVGGDDSEREAAIYTQTGRRLQKAYSFGLVGTPMGWEDIDRVIRKVQEVIDDGWLCWAVSNHDFKRAASRIIGEAPLKDKALFATALGLSLRGSYCMYQGEELGLPQAELAYEDLVDPYDRMLYPEHIGRDGCRTPMPWAQGAAHGGFSTTGGRTWLPVPGSHLPLAVDAQTADAESTLNTVRALLKWRSQEESMRAGHFTTLNTQKPLIGFRRHLGEADAGILCIFNAGDKESCLDLSSLGISVANLLPVSRNAGLKDDRLTLSPFGYAFLA